MPEDKKDIVIKSGVIREYLPNAIYRVDLEDGTTVIAHISGRMRRNFIRVYPKDRIKVEFSKHDLTRGRIVYRY